MKFVESRPDDIYFQALLADHANLAMNMCPYRGYTIVNRADGQEPVHEIMVCLSLISKIILIHKNCMF